MSAWKQRAGKGGDYEHPPAGNHPAVLVAMIDMGTQEQEFHGEIKEQHRAYFVWELVNEKMKSGKSHVIGMDLTVSMNERAKLRAWIQARIGRPIQDGEEYDISQELGQPCLLNVVEKNGYPKVDGMSAVPKGMAVARATYPAISWHLDDYSETGKIDLPNWIPWLYGKPIEEHIRQAGELTGRTERPEPSSPAPNPPSSPPNAAPTPPSAPAPVAPSGKKYWLDLGNGQTADFTQENSASFLTERGVDVDKALVCDQSGIWKPASQYGLKTMF